MKPSRLTGILISTLALGVTSWAMAGPQEPAQAGAHQHHQAEVKRRGTEAMGFDQDKTTHHFRLTRRGGTVEVQANDAADTASRDHIRQHLQEVATKFKQGDFSAPKHTHGQVPPGVEQMKALSSKIDYKYEELERGGRLVISTQDPAARKAVHDFLRFQIKDHQTGDPTGVQ